MWKSLPAAAFISMTSSMPADRASYRNRRRESYGRGIGKRFGETQRVEVRRFSRNRAPDRPRALSASRNTDGSWSCC
jgi:hypothetical protein